MGYYSGLPNRSAEEKYYNLIKELIATLGQIIITFVEKQRFAAFQQKCQTIYHQIKQLDQCKFEEPRFAKIIQPLTQHFVSFDFPFSARVSKQMSKTSGRSKINFRKSGTKRLKNNEEKPLDAFRIPKREKTSSLQINSKLYKESVRQSLDQSELTMEQIIEKYPLVEKKLSLYKKRNPVRSSIAPANRQPDFDLTN